MNIGEDKLSPVPSVKLALILSSVGKLFVNWFDIASTEGISIVIFLPHNFSKYKRGGEVKFNIFCWSKSDWSK